MSGGGGPKNVTQTSKVELPAWANQYAQNIAGRAYGQTNVPYEKYPGQRIASLTPQQTQGLGMIEQYATNNPITPEAQNLLSGTLRGDYLDIGTNPAWEPMSQRISEAYRYGTAPQTDAAFARAGAFGQDNSAYNQQVLTNQRAYGDALSGLAGQLYLGERQNQQAALGMSPLINQMGYSNAQALIGAGDAYRQYQQDLLNQGYQDWAEQKNYPWMQMQNYANLTPALLGNQGTTTATGPNPNQSSPLAGAIGGGLAGYAGASMIPAIASTGYGLPIAALLGAGLGAGLLS
jgi:hypothetical protein